MKPLVPVNRLNSIHDGNVGDWNLHLVAVSRRNSFDDGKVGLWNPPTPWRQWHHWNINKDAATVKLSKGCNLLTLHIVKQGNMNLGILEFKLLKK